MAKDTGREIKGAGWVVGIGASAGGLEALTQFVSHLPEDFGGTIVIAQHLAPHAKSLLVDLLSRQATLKVVVVEDRQKLEPATVYVAPPNHDIEIVENTLCLTLAGIETRPKPSVDTFFGSLAREYGKRSVGIVLSGTGSDGSEGIRAIKSAGGVTIAQDDRSAKYDGMPKSAIETGSVDSVLPPSAIASTLLQILDEHSLRLESSRELDSDGVLALLDYIRVKTGTDFRLYKPSTIQRRIAKRMASQGTREIKAYREKLESTPGEVQELAQELLISVTSFFRDPEVFEGLSEQLTGVVSHKAQGQEVRAWIAGCATGEEAYTIAMILTDIVDRLRVNVGVKVFATDLDHDAILEARSGVYGAADVEKIPHQYRSRFVERRNAIHYELSKRIRDAVVFAKQDLIQNPPFVKLDFVSCRNVMIYFEPELQTRVLETFHYSLLPSGLLLLGKSETAAAAQGLFEIVDRKTKMFQKINVRSKINSNTQIVRATPIDTDTFRRRLDTGPTVAEVAYLRLLRAYGISGVVVDEDGNVIQVIGDVSDYLGFHTSQVDLRLANLLPKGIGIEIPILIRKAIKDGEAHRSRLHKVGKGAKAVSFNLMVRPLNEPGELSVRSKALFIVNFEPKKVKETTAAATATAVAQDEFPSRMAELEQELFVTREHLQTVIEELGVSNEELQSLNEELSSTNEELQASNEELETTNEELQSSNEELTTVNEELGIKSTELRSMNSSLENVQNSIGAPMVVVDERMRLRRYNNDALKVFAIGATDFGKDVTRLSSAFEIPDFEKRVREAIEENTPSETICENASSIYQMRVFPAVDETGKSTGAILMFIDNTDLLRTKERLINSEQRIRAIIDSSPALISLKDAMGRYLLVNDAFREFFGLEDKNIVGRTDREMFPDKLAVQFRDADLETLLKRQSFRREEQFEWQKGGVQRPHAFLVSRFPLIEKTGAAPYAVGTIAFDVSAQIETQEALRASEQRYRAIAEDQAVFVCRHTPDFKITYVNNVFSNYFGGDEKSNAGRNFDSIVRHDERAMVEREVRLITLDRPVVQYEHRVERFSQPERWVRWIHRGIFNSDGQVREYQAIGFDVTEYRQSTDELLRKEAVFTGIFNSTADYITVYRVTGQGDFVLESLNRSAEKSLRVAYTQLIGRRMEEFLNPAAMKSVLARYRRVVDSRKPEVFEEELQLPGGIKTLRQRLFQSSIR